MKKQILTGALVMAMLANGAMAMANESAKERLEIIPISSEIKNDKFLDLSKIETYDKDGTSMVALRQVAEEILGLDVKWVGETSSVEIGSGPQWTSITIGKNSYFFGRVAHFQLSQAPEIKNGKTYVPSEFFTEVLKYTLKNTEEETETPEAEGQKIRGFINKISENKGKYSVTIIGDENSLAFDKIILHISEDTVIVDKNGKELKIEDLKAGAIVEAKTMPFMTMSLPPQSTATKIVVINTETNIEEKNYKENKNIKYPAIEGIEKSKEINTEIEKLIKEIAETETYKDLDLVYDVKYLSEEKLSIVFYGNFKFGEEDKFLMKSLNFDLNTGKTIDFANYFKEDEESQKKLKEKLAKAVKEQFNIEFEAEGKQIFFTGSKIIVFYYPLDDTVTYPVNVELPLESLEGLIK